MNIKKTMKNVIALLLMAIVAFQLGGCVKNASQEEVIETRDIVSEQAQYPYIFTDSNGKEVVIDKEPQSIISVAPSITEFIYALGKDDRLIARTDYCDYPQEVAQVESIGSLTEPNIEKIIELNPDIVIASTHFQDDVAKKLDDLGINVVVLYDADNFDGVYELIGTLGNILNASDKANELVGEMKTKIENIQEKVQDEETPSMYYVVGFGQYGDYTATGETFIGTMIDIAGGDNIAKDATGWAYSLEKIIEKDPEYIVITDRHGMKDQFMIEAGYKELTAVKNNKVIEVDENLLSRQGPRLAEGIEVLAKILHPNLFE